ncbi:hypothetical protein SUGI_0336980 [Cryptomeria japonica]|nr:hypothetical protein SUGI_0336980 [Cryptomeria japonica]
MNEGDMERGASVKEKETLDANTVLKTIKVAGLHELVMLAEEFEYEEATEKKEVEQKTIVQASNSTNEEAYIDKKKHLCKVFNERKNHSKHKDEENTEEDCERNSVISNHHLSEVKSRKSGSNVLEKIGKRSSQMQKSRFPHQSTSLPDVVKIGPRGSTDFSSKGNNGERSQIAAVEDTVSALDGSDHQPIKVGVTRLKCTVPQPFALATDKRVSAGALPANLVVTNVSPCPTAGSVPLSSVPRKDQFSAKHDAEPLSKLSHSEKLNFKPTGDSKVKPGLVTSTSSFSFRCDVRAEKRKEFYSKLEQKLKAKELEKRQLQAKSKEQQEAELKMLRKSMTFRASPMPTFYHQGAPPKIELKKIPPTRAKSPKLGRRKSYPDVESENKANQTGRQSRFSLDEKKSNGSLQIQIEENLSKLGNKDENGKGTGTTTRSLNKMYSEKYITPKSNAMSLSEKQGIIHSPEKGLANGSAEEFVTSTISSNLSASTASTYTAIPQKFEAVEEHIEVESSVENSEIVQILNDRENMSLQECEFAEEENGAKSLDGQDLIAEVDVQAGMFKESFFPVNIVQDANNKAAYGTEDLQILDGLKLNLNKSVSNFQSDGQNGQMQENNMDIRENKLKSIRRSQPDSAVENNGKAVSNPRKEQLKVVTPYSKNSKRGNEKLASSRKLRKGNNAMAPMAADVSVQS